MLRERSLKCDLRQTFIGLAIETQPEAGFFAHDLHCGVLDRNLARHSVQMFVTLQSKKGDFHNWRFRNRTTIAIADTVPPGPTPPISLIFS
jgi:hypothetical protein